MVESDLDRRIAEAAAAVDALRSESRQLDEDLEARRADAEWPSIATITRIDSCPEVEAWAKIPQAAFQEPAPYYDDWRSHVALPLETTGTLLDVKTPTCVDPSEGFNLVVAIGAAAEAAAALERFLPTVGEANRAADAFEHSVLTPLEASSSPAADIVAIEAFVEQGFSSVYQEPMDYRAVGPPPFAQSHQAPVPLEPAPCEQTPQSPSPQMLATRMILPTPADLVLLKPVAQPARASLCSASDVEVAPEMELERPSERGARPPRQQGALSQDFPSDADIAAMSRRERIALLEGTGAAYAEGNVGASADTRPRGHPTSETSDHAAHWGSARCNLMPDEASALSRRERIALLELSGNQEFSAGRCGGLGGGDSGGDGGQEVDEAWLERRRQSRKSRLQQHTAPRSRAAAPAQKACPGAEEVEWAAALPPRAIAVTVVAAPSGLTTARSAAVVEELESLLRRGDLDDVRMAAACSGLAANAHKLTPGGLAKASESLAAAASSSSTAEPPGQLKDVVANFGEAVDALIACLAPHLRALGNAVLLRDVLRLMAAGRVTEQAYLDVVVAQLHVLLRQEKGRLAPSWLSDIAGSLGVLHNAGLSAKRGGSGAGVAANRRCVETLCEQIVGSLGDFVASDIGRLGASYLIAYMDDAQRRAVLHRAAELAAGIGASVDEVWLQAAMRDVERALRRHSFAFIASLPDETKDYLMRLKATEP